MEFDKGINQPRHKPDLGNTRDRVTFWVSFCRDLPVRAPTRHQSIVEDYLLSGSGCQMGQITPSTVCHPPPNHSTEILPQPKQTIVCVFNYQIYVQSISLGINQNDALLSRPPRFFLFIVKHVYLGWLIVKLSYLYTVYVHLQLLAVLSN